MSILNVNQIQPVGGGNTITVSASDISASGATITATSFVGSLTGAVTGNVTGNLTGNVTSSSTSTFSSGINVTGGNVGVGTNNPARSLDVNSGGSTDIVQFTNNSGTTLTFGSYSGMTTLDVPSSTGFRIRSGGSSGEHFTLDSAGRLLLGTTTEGYTSADDLTVATTGNTGITIRSGTGSLSTIAFSDGTSGDAEYRGYFQYDHNGDFLKIGTAGSERLRITSGGDIRGPLLASGSGTNIYPEFFKKISGFHGGGSTVNYILICTATSFNVRVSGRLTTARGPGTSACASQLFNITFQTNHNGSHQSGAITGVHSGSDGYGHTEAEIVTLTYNSTNYFAIRFNGSNTGWTSDFDSCYYDGIASDNVLFTHIDSTNDTITNVSVLTADTYKGDVTIQQADLRISDGDIFMPSGHGISFAATANGGSSTPSELLDDYEEGTFTPTIYAGADNGSGGAPAFAIQAGRYIKIGRKVHCDIYIRFATGDLSTGVHARIGNLPFTIANESYGNVGASNLTRGGGVSTFQNTTQDITTCYGSANTGIFYLYKDGEVGFVFGGSNNANLAGKYWIGIFEYICTP